LRAEEGEDVRIKTCELPQRFCCCLVFVIREFVFDVFFKGMGWPVLLKAAGGGGGRGEH
jgi:hypothetical protein